MGFYDELDGNQVKCFHVPYLQIKENTIDMGTDSGIWRYYNIGAEVPYRTKFYNYGENFMIFDYRASFWKDNFDELVHIIENGRYVKSISYKELSENHPIYLVVDNYGRPLKVKTISDFKKIVVDDIESSKKYTEYTKLYQIRFGAIPIPFMSSRELKKIQEEKGWSDEMVLNQIEKNHVARTEAYKYSISPFVKEWHDKDKEAEIFGGNPIGVIYEIYCSENRDKYDWDGIINKLKETALSEKTSIEHQVISYISWTESQKIKIDKKELLNLFKLSIGGLNNG